MSEWKKVKFGDICELYDGPHATPKPAAEGPIFLGIKSITEDGRIRSDIVRHISWDEYPKWTKRVTPQQGDIVFSYEATLHQYCIIPDGFVGCLGRRMALLRVKNRKANNFFLYYYLRSEKWRAYIEQKILHGSTVDRISIKDFPTYEVELPTLPEQDRIVDVIGNYDNLIENNNRRIAILEEMAHRLYREWFVHFRFPGHENVEMVDSELGLIPEGWEMRTPKELAEHYIGGGWGKENKNTTLQPAFVIRGTDIPDARRNNISNCPLRFHTESNLKDRCLSNGDIVMEVSGGSKGQPVGRPLLITEELLNSFNGQRTICASFCKLYRCNLEEISPYYLYLWLLEIYRNGEIEKYQSQSTGIINFKFEYFLDSPIVLVPDFEVRKAFDKQIEMIFKQINLLGRKNITLRKTRDHLLPRLISGDIDVSKIEI